jgi:glyoxylase-like metal-dependent hydrolase (beta-lactamase superfamily II)
MPAENWICVHCGLQHDAQESPPARCLNCSDKRESMTHKLPRWTTLAEMAGKYSNVFTPLGDGVTGICTAPPFGIGPEVFFIQTATGNVLWDCVAYLDHDTLGQIQALGGISAIVISHPHMFGSVVEWSHALGKIPIYIHEDNRGWMPRPDAVIHWWPGETLQINSDLTTVRIGGHFPGSCVLYWPDGAAGKGALFTGDGILPVEDRRWVSFMYSYPNLVPISKRGIERIVSATSGLEFDRIYGGPMYGSQGGRPIIESGAKDVVMRSAKRYIEHLEP